MRCARLVRCCFALVLVCSGCHWVFGLEDVLVTPDVSGRDVAADVAADVARDALRSDGPRDTAPDAPGKLMCEAPTVVGTNTSPVYLYEAGIRVDGLELHAFAPGLGHHVTKRSVPGGLFGNWLQSDTLPGAIRDPTWFADGPTEHLVAVLDRKPVLCAPSGTWVCQPLNLTFSDGAPTDMDGPSVRVIAGVVTMVLNGAPSMSVGSEDIYIATAGSDLEGTWSARPIPTLSDPTYGEDDPVLAPDGSFILFAKRPDPASPSVERWALHIAYETEKGVFGQPEPLSTENDQPSDNDDCPELYELGGGRFELYFDRGPGLDSTQIYRSVCVLTR